MKKVGIVFAAFLFSFGYAGMAFAAVTNGSFETGASDPGVFATLNAGDTTSIPGWSIDSGSVDYIGTYWQASDGQRSIDLNGVEAGIISQSIPTVIGDTYTVTFDLSGNPDVVDPSSPYYSPTLKDVKVSATGAPSQDFTYDTVAKGNTKTAMLYDNDVYTFTATSLTTTISFASQIGGAIGPVLDNVAVTEAAPVVASCPVGTNQTLLETVPVNSASTAPTPSIHSLVNGQTYVLSVSGTWQNSNLNAADAEYASVDGWASYMDGYNITPYFLGAGEFDLQIDGAFVNWGTYSPTHQYSYLYSGTGTPVNLFVFDGDSTQPNPLPNLGWYGDNSGSLNVNIYSCTPIPPPPPTTGTISGMKFNDLNRDGKKEANEPGLQGWTIRLETVRGVVLASTVTDANGLYSFPDLAPGTYKLREVHQIGWKRMTKNPKPIVIVGGTLVADVNFGNAQVHKGEKCDNDQDDNRDDQQGTYNPHHGLNDYGHDSDSKDHDGR